MDERGAAQAARPEALTRVLLWCGVVAGPLFIGVFLIEGTRAGYDPVGMTVSQLATGQDGWTQTVNFLVTGVLMTAFAAGVARALGGAGRAAVAGPALLAVFGLGIVGAGLFATDPGGGYPPGVRPPLVESTHSTVHELVSLVVFLTLPATCLVFASRFASLGEPGWAAGSAIAGVGLAVLIAVLLAGHFGTEEIGRLSGLIQRAWILLGWGWVTALGLRMLRSPDGAATPT